MRSENTGGPSTSRLSGDVPFAPTEGTVSSDTDDAKGNTDSTWNSLLLLP